jgi:hypothetical protein
MRKKPRTIREEQYDCDYLFLICRNIYVAKIIILENHVDKTIKFDLNNSFICQPDSWDEDEDGIWKPPKVPNPAYKGHWKRKVCFSIYRIAFILLYSLSPSAFYTRFMKCLMHFTCRKLRILTTRVNGRSHGLITQVSVVNLRCYLDRLYTFILLINHILITICTWSLILHVMVNSEVCEFYDVGRL